MAGRGGTHVIPGFEKLRQENHHELEANLDYIVRLSQKERKREGQGREGERKKGKKRKGKDVRTWTGLQKWEGLVTPTPCPQHSPPGRDGKAERDKLCIPP